MIPELLDFRGKISFAGRVKELARLLRLSVSTGFFNIIRIIAAPLNSSGPIRTEEVKRLLVLGAGGIGNHLMLYPVLAAVRRTFPDMDIHLVVSSTACARLLPLETGLLTGVSVINVGRMSSLRRWIIAARSLKKIQPEAIVAAAGTEPVRGGIISLLAGAGIRIGEQWRGRAVFYTHTVQADATISETRQNFNLAGMLGVNPVDTPFQLTLSADENKDARRIMQELTGGPAEKIVGVHAGSGREQQWKRWPLENFIQTAHYLTESENVQVIFFIGPDEADLKGKISRAASSRILTYEDHGRLRQVAAMIACCNVFLSNDSGLLHIASAAGVKTVGLFGPTSVARNWTGKSADAVIHAENVLCRPCHYTRWWLSCGECRPCLSRITPEEVTKKVRMLLDD